MSHDLLPHLVNILGGSLVFLLSWLIGRRFPEPFFRPWTHSFGLVLAFLGLEFAVAIFGRHPLHTVAGAGVLALASWALLKSGRLLRGRPAPGWRPAAAIALGAAASAAVTLGGGPFTLAIALAFVPFSVVMCRLGWYFVRGDRRSAWLGWPLLLLGSWPYLYPYPLLVETSWAWLGYAGSGLLHMLVGVCMVAHMLEGSWERYRKSQEELGRLKDEFVTVVSHELRTPLTALMGHAEFLEEELDGPLTEGQRQHVERIQEGTRQLRRLVDDLLDLSMREGGGLRLLCQEGDLAARARAVVESFEPQAQALGVALSGTWPASAVAVDMDADRIGQVIGNLLANALKFTPAGGTVHVTVEPGPMEVCVRVSDTGCGIPAAQLPHVFEKFYQGDADVRSRGVGLGLSIARTIVEAHGGRIGCDSDVGKGSTFWFVLPRVALARVDALSEA